MSDIILSKKQQKKALRSKKANKQTVKNVLAAPEQSFWPLLKEDDVTTIQKALETNLPRVRQEKATVKYKEIANLSKADRKGRVYVAMKTSTSVPIFLVCLTIVTAECGGHFSVLEELKGDFVSFHQKMIQEFKNKSWASMNKGLTMLDKYEVFLSRLDGVEKYYLPNLFRISCWEASATQYYKVFRGTSRKNMHEGIDMSSSIAVIVKFPILDKYASFRRNITEGCFRNTLNNIPEESFSGYSKFQLSYVLYQLLTITELKLTILASFKNIYDDRDFSPSFRNYQQMFMNSKYISYDIWRRDPDKYIKGKTYMEIEQYAQGYVVDTGSIKGHEKKCSKGCSEYSNVTTKYNCRGSKYCLSAFSLCRGIIDDCQELPGVTTLCLDESPRLYKYGKSSSKKFGEESECPSKKEHKIEASQCKYCVCTCYQHKDTGKYISMRAARSNVDQHRVVTGVRLYSRANILHIQVQEGRLGKNGSISGSPSWVHVEHVTIADRHLHLNQDFFMVSRDSRGVNLDDLEAPKNKKDFIITGVRFRKLAGRLALQIQLTKFSFECGTLFKDSSFWHENLDHGIRTAIDIHDSDIPTKSEKPSNMVTSNGKYVMFTHTSFNWDFAQTTVPFFDSQDVVSKIPGPLQGMGIYFKQYKTNSKKYGGFLGLKVITYDYRTHLDSSTMCVKNKC